MAMPSTLKGLSATACAAAFAVGVTSCGDNDDQPQADKGNSTAGITADQASADNSTAQDDSAPASTRVGSDEEQIKTLVASVQQAFKDGDGQQVCNSLAEPGQRDLVYYGRLTNLPGSCAEVATGIAERNKAFKRKQPPPHVVKVRVNGNRAVALIRLSDTAPARQSYTKVDGVWKVRSFRIGEAVAGKTGPPQ